MQLVLLLPLFELTTKEKKDSGNRDLRLIAGSTRQETQRASFCDKPGPEVEWRRGEAMIKRICLECDHRYTGGIVCPACGEPAGEPIDESSMSNNRGSRSLENIIVEDNEACLLFTEQGIHFVVPEWLDVNGDHDVSLYPFHIQAAMVCAHAVQRLIEKEVDMPPKLEDKQEETITADFMYEMDWSKNVDAGFREALLCWILEKAPPVGTLS